MVTCVSPYMYMTCSWTFFCRPAINRVVLTPYEVNALAKAQLLAIILKQDRFRVRSSEQLLELDYLRLHRLSISSYRNRPVIFNVLTDNSLGACPANLASTLNPFPRTAADAESISSSLERISNPILAKRSQNS